MPETINETANVTIAVQSFEGADDIPFWYWACPACGLEYGNADASTTVREILIAMESHNETAHR